MKKWIFIGVGIFLLVVFAVAAVVLPKVAQLKRAALKVAADNEAREIVSGLESEMPMEMEEDTLDIPIAAAATEGLSGTYQREDESMRFKLVLEESGTFKSSFENFLSKTFDEQASGDWKLVDEEVHLSYETPADYAERGLIHIFRGQEDGSLSQIAGIVKGKRQELSKEQQAETLDWMK